MKLPVADNGSRLGHVMIDPRHGMNSYWPCAVVDHPEREELKSSSGDRDDIPPFRDCALIVIG